MSMFYPLVSIVTPVYTVSNKFENAIDSALAKTYEDVDVLVENKGCFSDKR